MERQERFNAPIECDREANGYRFCKPCSGPRRSATGSARLCAWARYWSQRFHAAQYLLRDRDQFNDKSFVHLEVSFVFAEISALMAKVQNSPLGALDRQSVRKTLEYQVAILRPVSVPAQRREREGVGRVVREVEAALERVRRVFRVVEPDPPVVQQPVKLRLCRGLRFQLSDLRQVCQVLRAHAVLRSGTASAVPASAG